MSLSTSQRFLLGALALCALSPLAHAQDIREGRVTARILNVRSSPNGRDIGNVRAGETVSCYVELRSPDGPAGLSEVLAVPFLAGSLSAYMSNAGVLEEAAAGVGFVAGEPRGIGRAPME